MSEHFRSNNSLSNSQINAPLFKTAETRIKNNINYFNKMQSRLDSAYNFESFRDFGNARSLFSQTNQINELLKENKFYSDSAALEDFGGFLGRHMKNKENLMGIINELNESNSQNLHKDLNKSSKNQEELSKEFDGVLQKLNLILKNIETDLKTIKEQIATLSNENVLEESQKIFDMSFVVADRFENKNLGKNPGKEKEKSVTPIEEEKVINLMRVKKDMENILQKIKQLSQYYNSEKLLREKKRDELEVLDKLKKQYYNLKIELTKSQIYKK